MKVIELDERIVFCDDILEIYKDTSYYSTRYYLITKNRTSQISYTDYQKIQEYLLSLNRKGR